MKNIFILLAVLVTGSQAQEVHAATIGETISNASAIIGNDVMFFCEVIGSQEPITEDLVFSKPPSLVISQNENVINTTKHSVTGKYNLTIHNTVWSDEGQYDCSFGASTYTAYLVISDPPTGSSIYWEGGNSWTPQGETNNLTCESDTSRPPATFRWFRGSTEIFDAIYEKGTVDVDGYGKAYSYLERTPSSSDEGTVYTCYVDVPGGEGWFHQTLAVSFSGAGQIAASMGLLLASLLLSLRS